jgi:hypothetical protein
MAAKTGLVGGKNSREGDPQRIFPSRGLPDQHSTDYLCIEVSGCIDVSGIDMPVSGGVIVSAGGVLVSVDSFF